MRAVLLTSARGWRGSGVSYAKIARGLLERGHDVRVVAAGSRLTDRLVKEGLPVTQLPGRRTGPMEVWELWRILRRAGATVILADTPRDVRLSACATLMHRAGIVYRYNLGYSRSTSRLMDRFFLSRVAACIYQSRFIRREALSCAPPLRGLPSTRIPNGYDTTFFAANQEAGLAFRARYDIGPGVGVVLTAAKLTRGKGHDVAIDALDRVRRDGREVVYLVCGEGPKEAELRELAGRRSLRTIFTGLLEPADMVAALSAADVVVHPSLREILPNAVGEAMSCARPVVAADAGGTSELVGRDGTAGVLVPAGAPEPLADAVQLLLGDRELREEVGGAARRRIEEKFPLSRMIDGYETGLTLASRRHVTRTSPSPSSR